MPCFLKMLSKLLQVLNSGHSLCEMHGLKLLSSTNQAQNLGDTLGVAEFLHQWVLALRVEVVSEICKRVIVEETSFKNVLKTSPALMMFCSLCFPFISQSTNSPENRESQKNIEVTSFSDKQNTHLELV